MRLPPRIPTNVQERTARRSMPTTFDVCVSIELLIKQRGFLLLMQLIAFLRRDAKVLCQLA
jgi:hypothetical protein